MRRWWLIGLGAVILLAGLGTWALWHSEGFWRWSVERLFTLARERWGVEIRAAEMTGHPLTGLR